MRRSYPHIAYPRGTIPCAHPIARQDYPSLRLSRITNATAPLTARYGSRPDARRTTATLEHPSHDLAETTPLDRRSSRGSTQGKIARRPVTDSEIDAVPNSNLPIPSVDMR